jgi:hypothetical protein
MHNHLQQHCHDQAVWLACMQGLVHIPQGTPRVSCSCPLKQWHQLIKMLWYMLRELSQASPPLSWDGYVLIEVERLCHDGPK